MLNTSDLTSHTISTPRAQRTLLALFTLIFAIICAFALTAITPDTAHAATPTQKYGTLKVKGTQLTSAKTGKPVQLRGVSTHGINWDVGYPYISKAAFKTLRDTYGVNCIRLSMYTTDYFGYCNKSGAWESQAKVQTTLKKRIDTGVKAASDLGMYVIIDWHVLNDHNPNKYKKQAVAFFKDMAKKYAKRSNVIYEICNEPNGDTSWSQIKSYANSVIPAIRTYDKDAIVICGTPNWSQDVDVASKSPLKHKNVLYAVHFYANTHKDAYRNKVKTARKNGLPIFASEFSITDASGNGALNKTQGTKWLDMLDSYKISYCAWSLTNKAEASALLKSSTTKRSGWKASHLSSTGKWILGQYQVRNKMKNTTYQPSAVSNLKVKKASAKSMQVTFSKKSGVKGYQISYATNKNFKKAKTVKTTRQKTVVKKLTKHKTYYVKVRAYTTFAGKNVYGSWSAAKKVRL